MFIGSILDKMKYLKILKKNLKRSLNKLNLLENYYSQQDNYPKHSDKIVKKWLLYNIPHSP